MAQLPPLNPIEDKLYRVQVAEHLCVSGIEAPDARTAMAKAENSISPYSKKYAGKSLSADCENIYEASIGLETDVRDDAPDDLDTLNGIFEIKIRGCDPKRVNELKLALMNYVGGPCIEDEEDEEFCDKASLIERAFEGTMVTGY